jgi:hypothetical protein
VSQPHGWAVVSLRASRCSVTVLLNLDSVFASRIINVRLSHSISSCTLRIARALPLHHFVVQVEYTYMLIYKIKPHYLSLKQINTIHHYGKITRITAITSRLNLDSVFVSHIVKHRMNGRHRTSSYTFGIKFLLPLQLFGLKVDCFYRLIYKIKRNYLRLKQINTLRYHGNIIRRTAVILLLNLDSCFRQPYCQASYERSSQHSQVPLLESHVYYHYIYLFPRSAICTH